MSTMPNEKWEQAAAELYPRDRKLLLELKQDYETASKIHVPKYTGGPNPGILAELIRLGWRKSN